MNEANSATAVAPPRPDVPTAAEIADPLRAPAVRKMMGRYRGPAPDDIDKIERLCALLARGRATLPHQHRESDGDMAQYLMRAVDLDVGVSTALDNLHFDQHGRCAMRARLMHALVIRAGHKVQVTHADNRQVRMRLVRCDGQPSGSAAWHIAEAQAAGLIGGDKKNAWRTYAADMLWARCLSRLTRRYAPDVTAGMHEVSELLDGIDDEQIDAVDMSTAVVDADGNLAPSPDVVALLDGVDVATYEEITAKWAQAKSAGLLGAYAGTVDGVDHLVEEILFNRGMQLQPAEQRPDDAGDGAGSRVEPDASPVASSAPEPVADTPVADMAAGSGDRLPCGCRPAALMAAGRHETGCGQAMPGARR